MEERLQKIISRVGVASRRKAEELVAAGRVTVDGAVVREAGTKADAAKSRICVDGKPLPEEKRRVYFLLNKPKGYVSTVADERGRRTVLDLLPENRERVYPVGRLDQNTEGLLLLTNDGALTHALLHPRFLVYKTYRAKVAGELTPERLKKLRGGLALEDGMTAPAEVRVYGMTEKGLTDVEITLHEGRNRQVRRMFEAVGCDVRTLKRTRFAQLTLAGLKRGSYRMLTQAEVAALYRLVDGR